MNNKKVLLAIMAILFAVALSGCAGYYAAGYSDYPYGHGYYGYPYGNFSFRYYGRERDDYHHHWSDHHERHEGWR